jgi:hypothetical protein
MIVVYGTRLFGRVHRCAETAIATRFFHVWYVPLLPLSSHLILGEEEQTFSGFDIGFDPLSILAAYARSWGIVATIFLVIEAMTTSPLDGSQPLGAILGAALATAMVVYAFVRLGRLSSAADQEQRIYSDVVRLPPVDVGRLPEEQRTRLRDTLRPRVQPERPDAGTPYRGEMREWYAVAADPKGGDVGIARRALTLARLEWSLAPRPYRAEWAKRHAAIAARLRAQAE